MKILISSLEGFFSYNLETQTLTLINDVPCFGLTFKNNRYYLFIHSPFGEKFNNPINKDLQYNKGKVISFVLLNNQLIDIKNEVDDLDYKTHQINFMKDDLIIQETYQQQLTVYNINDSTKYITKPLSLDTYKYCHMNAVTYYDGKVYVLAPYIKGKNRPKLIILDKQFTVLEEIELPGKILHDLHIEGDVCYYVCSSCQIYQFNYRTKTVIETYKFTKSNDKWMRGLIVTDKYFVVGCGNTVQRIDRTTKNIEVFNLNCMLFPAILILL